VKRPEVGPALDHRPGRAVLLGKSLLAGGLLATSFPPFDLTFVAFVGLVPLLGVLEDLARTGRDRPLRDWGGSAFLSGMVTGFVYFLALLWWIVVLDAPSLTIPWVRYPGTLAIVGYLALFHGIFALAYAWIRARVGTPPAFLAPLLWTICDLARARGQLAFPWGELGYSQVPFLPALQIAAVLGLRGITAWTVLVNTLALPLTRPGGFRFRPALWLLLVFGLPVAGGALRLARSTERPTARVALVQPDVGNDEKWDPARRAEIFENMASLTRAGVEAGADLVVWPETAAPCYLLKDRTWRPWVEELVAEGGTPLLAGMPDYEIVEDGEERRVAYRNTGAFFDGTGRFVDRMYKIQLVPFGERVPFSDWIGALDRVDFGEADFIPGTRFVLFDGGGWKFGNLVCFEAIFPHLTRRYAVDGAEMLVNITNDSWFGAGSGAEQHARMAVARCVETGCGMARCANSGISLGADPYGRITGRTPLFERTLSVVDVPLRRGWTPYVRLGDWIARLSLVGAPLLIVAAFLRGRKGVPPGRAVG
jgi:apolipoprotein N-acyltransferase